LAIVNVRLDTLPSLLKEDIMSKPKQVLDAVRLTVRSHAPRLALEAVARVRPHQPVDRGTYRRSFKVENLPTGVSFYNYSPHAGIIELGRRPGARMPPIEVIEAWVWRKFRVQLAQARREAGKVLGARKKDYAKQRVILDAESQAVKRMAFLVARKIKSKGLPAHRIMKQVEDQLKPMVHKAIRDALAKP
jgi:hypothetical protein